jgi:hypothetical protein
MTYDTTNISSYLAEVSIPAMTFSWLSSVLLEQQAAILPNNAQNPFHPIFLPRTFTFTNKTVGEAPLTHSDCRLSRTFMKVYPKVSGLIR